MKFINPLFILTAILCLTAFSISAQEIEETVVDEVIAQVNEEVITLSQINRELEFTIKTIEAEGKTRKEAEDFVEKQKGQLIANIINESLLIQRGKEVGLDKEVQAEINARFRKQMTDNNIKTLEELRQAMAAQGIDMDDLQKLWEPQIMRGLVLSELVDRPLFFEITDKEIKDYYAKNIDQFKTEATITISEIFLSLAGRDEPTVRQKANDIVNRLRNGEDFEKLALENSDRLNVQETGGKAGTFNVSQLDKVFAEPLKNLKAGEISDPIIIPEGIEIIKVDARTKESDESTFNEQAVRQAIWKERAPEARKKFIKDLKEDAYIKIREKYRPLVTPFLNADPGTTADTTASK